ncbi:MAG: metallophosphoesterase family protein [Desulfobacterales bacterium]|nr:metallophosphoesterase family protein [Desulfobacterales bacterium]
MKIGVISDTHLSEPSIKLNRLIQWVFKDVDLILHAGDLTRLKVLDAFFPKEVIAVSGNMDRLDVSSRLPVKEVVKFRQYRIGLIHGWGSPSGLEDRIVESFDNVHAIVYGHSHMPANHIKNGVLMFNPGAFSGSFLRKKESSVGILTIDEGITGAITTV